MISSSCFIQDLDAPAAASRRHDIFFTPLQSAYGSAVATHTHTTRTGINKALFWNFYKLAKHEAYTKNNIKSAWRATSVQPFNPDKVLAKLEKKNTK